MNGSILSSHDDDESDSESDHFTRVDSRNTSRTGRGRDLQGIRRNLLIDVVEVDS